MLQNNIIDCNNGINENINDSIILDLKTKASTARTNGEYQILLLVKDYPALLNKDTFQHVYNALKKDGITLCDAAYRAIGGIPDCLFEDMQKTFELVYINDLLEAFIKSAKERNKIDHGPNDDDLWW
jgi:hypothetical protein